MNNRIGIRHEDKYLMERRVPIVPIDAEVLSKKQNIDIIIESSQKRIFSDDEYIQNGLSVTDNINDADVIIGVKEIPIEKIRQNKIYVFFSHVIKGQAYNMPMLKKMMEMKCSLIDYEKITDEQGRRLIFFGRFAGLAGMINTLWSLGQRYKVLGIDTPFKLMRQAHTYSSLDEAISDVKHLAELIKKDGLPQETLPFVGAFTGYGNVSKGSWEIFDLLPHKSISPEELSGLKPDKHLIYKVVFKEQDLSERIQGDFDLNHYYENPSEYKDKFGNYLHHFNFVVNGMYWDERYPRIISKENLKALTESEQLKLCVIGDITCDPNGSVECTHKGTEIEDPVFVYNPVDGSHNMGFKGEGVCVMAVDILPSELPRESSEAFSGVLSKFILEIADCDFNADLTEIVLSKPIKRALILHNGVLTPDYEYIGEFL